VESGSQRRKIQFDDIDVRYQGESRLRPDGLKTAGFDPGCVETLAEFRYDGRAGLDGWFFGFGYLSG
jgi:hypothetical protein